MMNLSCVPTRNETLIHLVSSSVLGIASRSEPTQQRKSLLHQSLKVLKRTMSRRVTTEPPLPVTPRVALRLPAYASDRLLRKTCDSATSHGHPQSLISSGASPNDVLLLILQELGNGEMSPYSSYVDLSQTEITKTGVELRWKRFQFDKDDYCHLPEVGLSPEDGQISCSSPHFNPALPAQYWYAAVQFLQDCMAVEDPVGKLDAVLNSSCLSGGGRMRHLGIRNAYQKLKRTGSVDDDNAVARAVRSMTSSLPEKDVEELRPVLTACFDLCPPTRQKSVSKVLKARHSELHPPTRQESVSPA